MNCDYFIVAYAFDHPEFGQPFDDNSSKCNELLINRA